MSEKIKCGVPECPEYFEYSRAQPNRRYCHTNCRAIATARRRRERARLKKNKEEEPRRPPIDPLPVPRRMNVVQNGYGVGASVGRFSSPEDIVEPERGGVLDTQRPVSEEQCHHEQEDDNYRLLLALLAMGEVSDISIRPGEQTDILAEIRIKPRT